ncbi:MAG: cell division protein ZapB [Arsenophonus sp. ER-BJ3-MAG3]
MSFEVFEKLEAKVKQAIETIEILRIKVIELKENNNNLYQEIVSAKEKYIILTNENENLKKEQYAWQERLRGLLSRIEDVQ